MKTSKYQLTAEFSFVPLDRARRSPVEETPVADPSSSLQSTGGSSADAAIALSRGFVRDVSEILTNVSDHKLPDLPGLADISDKKFIENAGQNNYTTKGGNDTLEEVRLDKTSWGVPRI